MSIKAQNHISKTTLETDFESIRVEWLLQALIECYGAYAPGELEDLLQEGDFSVQRLIEIQTINRDSITMIDAFDDIIFHDVRIPERIKLHLRPADQFLATLVMRDGNWHAMELLYWAIDETEVEH